MAKAPNALEGFIGGFFVVELLDVVVFDQSMPARSSIVTRLGLWQKGVLRNFVYSKSSEHIICQRVWVCGEHMKEWHVLVVKDCLLLGKLGSDRFGCLLESGSAAYISDHLAKGEDKGQGL